MTLLIDNYDSFTYNLYQYMGEFDKNIVILRNDCCTIEDVYGLNPDRIVISPGPKRPEQAGNCIEIIKEFYDKKPILGICLGHQAIIVALGGIVSNAKELYHGKASFIEHSQDGIFEGLPNPMQAARYHSLSGVEEKLPYELQISAKSEDDEIMAVEHCKYPVVGLQFHPESIYTPDGFRLIENFMQMK